jgi:hypothetical protein
MAGDFHCHSFGDPCSDHIPYRSSSEVME